MNSKILALYKQLRVTTLNEQESKTEDEKRFYYQALDSFLARETCAITIGISEMVLYIIEEQDIIKKKDLSRIDYCEIILCKNLSIAIRTEFACKTKEARINFRAALEERLKRETFQMSVVILQMLLYIIGKEKVCEMEVSNKKRRL